MQRLLSVRDVAKMLAVSKETVWRLVRAKQLPAANITSGKLNNPTGRRMRLLEADVIAFVRGRMNGTGK
ncbi:MAG: helix-turn-helix domain-containing protein [Acidobacteria bacterium]|nr:helix-turn-helix domain-containing protein [Acidobacteriota bacterium]